MPTGTEPPASAIEDASCRFSMPVTLVPESFQVMRTTSFCSRSTRVPSMARPSASRVSICAVAAEKKRSQE